MKNQRIESLLQDWRMLSESNHAIAAALRELILSIDKDVSEVVKYGGILFSGTSPFCGVFAYAKHVSLEFSHGASLPDTFQVLEGQGKFRRHIKLVEMGDIHGKQVSHYVALAFQASTRS